jgi:hypothetical protein
MHTESAEVGLENSVFEDGEPAPRAGAITHTREREQRVLVTKLIETANVSDASFASAMCLLQSKAGAQCRARFESVGLWRLLSAR